MLNSILIRDFRTCKEVHIANIPKMLALVGKNGVGKSNVLQAIEWIAKLDVRQRIVFADIVIEFELDKTNYRYASEIKFAKVEKNSLSPEVIRIEKLEMFGNPTIAFIRENNQVFLPPEESENQPQIVQLSNTTSFINALPALLPAHHPALKIINKVKRFLDGIRYYPLHDLNPINNSGNIYDTHEYLKRKDNLINEFADDTTLIKLLHLKMTQPHLLEEIEEVLGSNGLGIIDNILIFANVISDSDPFYVIKFQVSADTKPVFYYQLSFGARRILNLIVSIFFDQSTVCLIEQPEDGIHPILLNKLNSLLRSYSGNRQFIIASHSSTVLDNMKPQEVRLIEMNNGVTSLRALSEAELVAASHYLENDGGFFEYLEKIRIQK